MFKFGGEPLSVLEKYRFLIDKIDPIRLMGHITKVTGITLETLGPRGRIGEICKIIIPDQHNVIKEVYGEIIGFNQRHMVIMPYFGIEGVFPGCEVKTTNEILSIPVSEELRGRILDGIGNPLDGKPMVLSKEKRSIFSNPPNPITKPRIEKIIPTGIRAIDGFLTMGEGQRMGIFAGSGVGKSTLLGMIARNAQADINVIALIGERGREVREFIEKDLGPEGLKKSVLVVATSDTSPLMRIRGAYTATTIAEYFRDQGYTVNLMLDSITRFSRAQREVGLASGEPPSSSGYPPSVFSTLPRLLERAGTSHAGTITGFYTVLVEGDDFNEPITDTVRGIIDGHILLKRELADKAHYPAIDILGSISRLFTDIVDMKTHRKPVMTLKELYAIYRENEDLINIGAYQKGSDPKIDLAIKKYKEITDFLKQEIEEKIDFPHTVQSLGRMAQIVNGK